MRTIEKDSPGETYGNTIEVKNLLKKGFYKLEFSNWETSKEPKIQPYSSISVDNQMCIFDNETEIQDLGELEGLLYIITSFDDSNNIYLRYVDVCFYEWDNIKNGFYTPSGNRVIASLIYNPIEKTYRNKKSYLEKSPLIKVMEYDVIIDGNTVKNINYFYHNGFFYTIGTNITAGFGGYILKTRDGENWQVLYESTITTGDLRYSKIGVANDILYFDAPYYTGSAWKYLAFLSYDGTTLVDASWTGGSYKLESLVYQDGKYIRFHETGSSYYSEDLEVWTAFSEGLTALDQVVVFNNIVFIAGDGKVLYSENGITFTSSNIGTRAYDCKLQLVNDSLFVTCQQQISTNVGVTNLWITSTDGLSFIQRPNFPNPTAYPENPTFGYINNNIIGINDATYLSTDGGETWSEILSEVNMYYSPSFDQMCTDSKTLFIPTYDNLLKTSDLNSFSKVTSPQELSSIRITASCVGTNLILCGSYNANQTFVISI